MFLSFHKYVNYYKRGKTVIKKMFGLLTFIIDSVSKIGFFSFFLFQKNPIILWFNEPKCSKLILLVSNGIFFRVQNYIR